MTSNQTILTLNNHLQVDVIYMKSQPHSFTVSCE